jgi:KaiC/GvpD/RAD55 family RecA-like ATPase
MWWPFGNRKEKEKRIKEKRFQEEYDDYVKRKEKERASGDSSVKKLPDIDEILNRSTMAADVADELVRRGMRKDLAEKVMDFIKSSEKEQPLGWIKIGVPGFDEMLENGVPKGSSLLVAGGPGSGKTILCLQTLVYAANNGEKCLYISFEESVARLKQHMRDFGWNVDELEEKGLLKVIRMDPFKISRGVEAMLAKAKGELLIDMNELPDLFPGGFKPNRIVLDSLSALGAAFLEGETGYRIYIEQLFRFFEKIGVTSFLISETGHVPTVYSRTGIEEFLADGVIVFYNVRRGNMRVRAIEILKMRGARHEKKIVPFEIGNNGITIFPTEPIFMEEEMKA